MRQSDRTEPMLRTLVAGTAGCGLLSVRPCCRVHAPGVPARGWSGGDGQEPCRRRVCLRIWRPGCGFRAVCVAAQALWVPVPPPNISVRLHTEAVGGQGTGRLERLT